MLPVVNDQSYPLQRNGVSLPGLRAQPRLVPFNAPRDDITQNTQYSDQGNEQTTFPRRTNYKLAKLPRTLNSSDNNNNPNIGGFNQNQIQYEQTAKMQNNFISEVKPYVRESNQFPTQNRLMQSMEPDLTAYNLNLRVRDLETKLFDLKSSMERRMMTLIDENPNKFIGAIKNIESKDLTLWHENSLKMQSTDSNIINLKEHFKKSQENVAAILAVCQKKIDDVEYRNSTLEKSLEGVMKLLKANSPEAGVNAIALHNNSTSISSMSTEMKLLRQQVMAEKESKDRLTNETGKQYKELVLAINKLESDNYKKLAQQKEEFLRENTITRDQIRKLEEVRMERLLGESEYMQNLIKNMERQIGEEIEKRLKHDLENKEWVKIQVNKFRDQINKEYKQMLEGESVFIKQMQESIVSLNEIVKNTREQLEASIISTQTLANENAKNLSDSIEGLKTSIFTKIQLLENADAEQSSRLSRTIQTLQELSVNLNNRIDNEVQGVNDKIIKLNLDFEENSATLQKRIEKNEHKSIEWMKTVEGKNTELFTEIHNSLKNFKTDMMSDRKEIHQRIDNLKNEIEEKQKLNEKLIDHIDQKLGTFERDITFKQGEFSHQWNNRLESDINKLNNQMTNSFDFFTNSLQKEFSTNLSEVEKNQEKALIKETDYLKKMITELKMRMEKIQVEYLASVNDKIASESKKINERISKEANELSRGIDIIRLDLNNSNIHLDEKLKMSENKLAAQVSTVREEAHGFTMKSVLESKNEILNYVEVLIKSIESEMGIGKEEVAKLIALAKEDLRVEIINSAEKSALLITSGLQKSQQAINEVQENVNSHLEENKKLMMDSINQKNEQSKALSRALFNEEAAERIKVYETLIGMMKKNLENLELLFKDSLEKVKNELQKDIDEKNKMQEQRLNETKAWAVNEFSAAQNNLQDEEIARVSSEYLNFLFDCMYTEEKHQHLDEIYNTFVNVEQNMNNNFDEVEAKMQQNVNDLTNKINDDFNKLNEQMNNNVSKIENDLKEFENLMKQNREEDNDKLNVEIRERKDADQQLNNRITDLDEHTKNEIVSLNDQIQETSNELQLTIAAHKYTSDLYNQIFLDEMNENNEANSKRFVKLENYVRTMDNKSAEDNDAFNLFKVTTNQNFYKAEETLVKLKTYLNAVDARLTLEEMVNRVCFREFEDKIALEFGILGSDLDTRAQGLENNIAELKKEIIEQHIPEQILRVTESLQELSVKKVGGLEKESENLRGELANLLKLLEEHKGEINGLHNTTKDHRGRIDNHDTEIAFLNEGLGQATAQIYADHIVSETNCRNLEEMFINQLTAIVNLIDDISQKGGLGGSGSSDVGDVGILIDEKIQILMVSLNQKLKDLQSGQTLTAQDLNSLASRVNELDNFIKKSGEEIQKIREDEKIQREQDLAEKKRLEEEAAAKKLLEEENNKKMKQLEDELLRKKQEEEEQKKKQEEEEQKRKQDEEEQKKKLEDDEQKKKLEEDEQQKKLEEEEQKKKLEEEEQKKKLEEEEKRKQEEEEKKKKLEEEQQKQKEQDEGVIKIKFDQLQEELKAFKDDLNIGELKEELAQIKKLNLEAELEKIKEQNTEMKKQIELLEENKGTKGGSSGAALDEDAVKKIQEVIANLNIEETLKKLDGIDPELLKKDIEKVKQLIEEMETEKAERDKKNNELNGKIDSINQSLATLQFGFKDELTRSSKENKDNFTKITQKIEEVIVVIQKVNEKVDKKKNDPPPPKSDPPPPKPDTPPPKPNTPPPQKDDPSNQNPPENDQKPNDEDPQQLEYKK